MAGQSGHNLSIRNSRRGYPRFPFERSDVGDGYAGAGPVITYWMSPEEIAARYGVPPTKSGARKPVFFNWKRKKKIKKEDKMEITVERNETAVLDENYEVLRNASQTGPEGAQPPERPKTQREILEEKLTKESYLQYKQEGLSDDAVLIKLGLPTMWRSSLTKLKVEWGLLGMKINTPIPVAAAAGAVREKDEPATARMTIAQALELRDELGDDINDLEYLLQQAEGVSLSPRLVKMLIWYHDEYQRCLERIKEVFNSVTIAI
ncbi:MAG: hypothetical protein C4589_11160 [Peptococcaceae bacterium]|nr:MAG: hypothetical protein C4589_11160 [Peptococcaceae bacterium]